MTTASFSSLDLSLDADPALLAHVNPANWINPKPQSAYDLVVIGGGAAGLVSAAGAAGLGARVALVERNRLGGDCLNTGCVPSKALAAFARSSAGKTAADRLESARLHLRHKRLEISVHDKTERWNALGIDLFFGQASFANPKTITVEGISLPFKRAALCSGASPALPSIAGLAECSPLTTDTFFDLNRLPVSLVIVGAGPVGVELAQSLARLGCAVTLVERGPSILAREDASAAQLVGQTLQADGVSLCTQSTLQRVEKTSSGIRVHLLQQGTQATHTLEAEAILVATGRAPNTAGLHLERAGIELNGLFPRVDPFLRTTNPCVYAAGDVIGPPYLTHRSGAHAAALIQNALFAHPLGFGKSNTHTLVIPRCLHTDPAIAQVGLTEQEATLQGIPHEVLHIPASSSDRIQLEEECGWLKLILAKGTDKLLGATVVSKHAGELIFPAVEMLQKGRGLKSLFGLILPYPTRMEIWNRAALTWRARRFAESSFTQRLVRLLTGFEKKPTR